MASLLISGAWAHALFCEQGGHKYRTAERQSRLGYSLIRLNLYKIRLESVAASPKASGSYKIVFSLISNREKVQTQ